MSEVRLAARLPVIAAWRGDPARTGPQARTPTPESKAAEAPVAVEAESLFPPRPGIARLRGIVALSGFLALTVAGMPFQLTALALRARGARRRIPHLYHRLVCRALGIRVGIQGTPARDGRVLFVANHCSWADITVLSAVHPVSFVAKHEIADWPFFGLLAKLQRSVFIDRERRTAVGRHRDAIRARLDQGDALVLFPEGTSSDGSRVLPFKTALFAIAETLEGGDEPLVVQPVSIVYTGRCGMPLLRSERAFVSWYGDMDLAPHLWDLVQRGPVEVSVIFHPPLAPADAKARKRMAAAASNSIAQGVARAIAGRP